MLRPVQCWPIAHACRNGKEGKGVYLGVSDGSVCVVCAREEVDCRALCLLFNVPGTLGFSEAVHY